MASRLKKAIGEKLREFRHKRYYTQEYLAELVELDIKQIGRIERGESYLKPENLEKFCKVLKVHPKDFYDFHWENEEEENIEMRSNGTYGRIITNRHINLEAQNPISIDENFQSDFDLIEFAYADEETKTKAKILNVVQTAEIEYLNKNFEKLSLYNIALKNLNKLKNNTKFLKTINYLAQLEK